MKSIITIAATTLGLAILAPTAQAALISGVTASTDMGAALTTSLVYTLNGAGLPGGIPSLSGDHVIADTDYSWLGSVGILTGQITFDLNGSYSLGGFSFWNLNGPMGSSLSGIRMVTVQSSTDGSSFYDILGAPTEFARGVDGPQPPEVFSFPTPVTASHVRFVVGSNWGAEYVTGFSEVQFDAASPAAVPEPTGIVGLLAIGGAFLTTKRRRA